MSFVFCSNAFLILLSRRENAQYEEREKIWQQIEELAKKKNPNFDNLVDRINYMRLSDDYLNSDNSDDYQNDKLDQYSMEVINLEGISISQLSIKTFYSSLCRQLTCETKINHQYIGERLIYLKIRPGRGFEGSLSNSITINPMTI